MPRPAWATFTALDLARGRRGLITPRSGGPRGRDLRIQLELSNRGLEDGSAHGLPLAVLAPPVGEVHLDPLDAGDAADLPFQALQGLVGHLGQPGGAPEDALQADDASEHAHADERELDAVPRKDGTGFGAKEGFSHVFCRWRLLGALPAPETYPVHLPAGQPPWSRSRAWTHTGAPTAR